MPSQLSVRLLVVALVVAAIVGAVSTGALSSVSAERDVTISVATDDTALLALRDGHPNAGLVDQESNGVLTLRFDRHGGDGINWNFVTTLGDPADPTNNHAFSIDNDGTQTRSIDLEYSLAPGATDGDTSVRNAIYTFHVDRGADGTIESTVEISEHSGDRTATIADVTTTDQIYVTIRFDTVGIGDASDLSGTLRIAAGET